jgi:hypothetical protein
MFALDLPDLEVLPQLGGTDAVLVELVLGSAEGGTAKSPSKSRFMPSDRWS